MATKKRKPGRPKGSKSTSRTKYLKIMSLTEKVEKELEKLELDKEISKNNAYTLTNRIKNLLALAKSIEAKAHEFNS